MANLLEFAIYRLSFSLFCFMNCKFGKKLHSIVMESEDRGNLRVPGRDLGTVEGNTWLQHLCAGLEDLLHVALRLARVQQG